MTNRPLPPTASRVQSAEAGKLHAPSAARNAEVLVALLARVAPPSGTALELASGTGQHIVHFAERLPHLMWQPTEIAGDRLNSIDAYIRAARLPNVRAPKKLNAVESGWSDRFGADLIVLVNLLHLISESEVKALLSEVAKALEPEGRFVVYGPFMRDAQLVSDGDQSFHASLTASDPEIGYKDDQDIVIWMAQVGLHVVEIVDMPANNLAFVAQRG